MTLSPSAVRLNELGVVHDELYDARHKWYYIGLMLGVPVETLDWIRHNFSNSSDCLRETLRSWLEKGGVATWQTVCAVLRSPIVGEHQLAREMEERYCSHQKAQTTSAGKALHIVT